MAKTAITNKSLARGEAFPLVVPVADAVLPAGVARNACFGSLLITGITILTRLLPLVATFGLSCTLTNRAANGPSLDHRKLCALLPGRNPSLLLGIAVLHKRCSTSVALPVARCPEDACFMTPGYPTAAFRLSSASSFPPCFKTKDLS